MRAPTLIWFPHTMVLLRRVPSPLLLPPNPLPQPVTIAMVGKYTDLSDAYLSVTKALQHACMAANRKLKVRINCAAGWWVEQHTCVLLLAGSSRRAPQHPVRPSCPPPLPAGGVGGGVPPGGPDQGGGAGGARGCAGARGTDGWH